MSKLLSRQVTNYELNKTPTKQIVSRREFLMKYIPLLHAKIRAKAYLLTINILKDELTLEESWEAIEDKLEQITQIIKKNPSTYYVLSGIEIHDKKKSTSNNSLSETTQLKYVFKTDNPEEKKEQVLKVFEERDEQLKYNPIPDEHTTVRRIIAYVANSLICYYKSNTLEKPTQDQIEFYDTIVKPNHYLNPDENIYVYAYFFLSKHGFLSLENPNTLTGYPHIHLAIVLKDQISNNQVKTTREHLENLFKDLFKDVKCTRSIDNTLDSDPRIIEYVLKNHAHKPVHERLGRPPVKLHNFDNDLDTNLVYRTLTQPPYSVYIANIAHIAQNSLPVLVYFQQTIDGRIKGEKRQPLTNEFHIKVIDFMSRNNYAFTLDGIIYQKIPGSKLSYCITKMGGGAGPFFTILLQYSIATMKNEKEWYRLANARENQITLPITTVDFSLIELKDGVYHLPSGFYYRGEPLRACHLYFPDFGVDDFVGPTSNLPRRWLSTLIKYPLYYNKTKDCFTLKGLDLLKTLYSLLLPKIKERKHPAFYFASDIDKSMIIAPLRDLIAKERLSELSSNEKLTSLGQTQLIMMISNMSLKNTDIKRNEKYLDTGSSVPLGQGKLTVYNDTNWLYVLNNEDQIYSNKQYRTLHTGISEFFKVFLFDQSTNTACHKLDEIIKDETAPIIKLLAYAYHGSNIKEASLEEMEQAILKFKGWRQKEIPLSSINETLGKITLPVCEDIPNFYDPSSYFENLLDRVFEGPIELPSNTNPLPTLEELSLSNF